MNGHAAVCALLVRAGADFNLKNSFGVSPFGEAEAGGHMEVTVSAINVFCTAMLAVLLLRLLAAGERCHVESSGRWRPSRCVIVAKLTLYLRFTPASVRDCTAAETAPQPS
jgi:hypothetical protein